MAVEARKTAVQRSSLKLVPSVRKTAEEFSAKEGVSLNHFINTAVAEKLDLLRHEEWVKNRKPYTEERKARALALLDKNRGQPVMPGDELPEGYVPERNTSTLHQDQR